MRKLHNKHSHEDFVSQSILAIGDHVYLSIHKSLDNGSVAEIVEIWLAWKTKSSILHVIII